MFYTKYKDKWLPLGFPKDGGLEIKDEANKVPTTPQNLQVDSNNSSYYSANTPASIGVDPCGIATPYTTKVTKSDGSSQVMPIYAYPVEADYNWTESKLDGLQFNSTLHQIIPWSCWHDHVNGTGPVVGYSIWKRTTDNIARIRLSLNRTSNSTAPECVTMLVENINSENKAEVTTYRIFNGWTGAIAFPTSFNKSSLIYILKYGAGAGSAIPFNVTDDQSYLTFVNDHFSSFNQAGYYERESRDSTEVASRSLYLPSYYGSVRRICRFYAENKEGDYYIFREMPLEEVALYPHAIDLAFDPQGNISAFGKVRVHYTLANDENNVTATLKTPAGTILDKWYPNNWKRVEVPTVTPKDRAPIYISSLSSTNLQGYTETVSNTATLDVELYNDRGDGDDHAYQEDAGYGDLLKKTFTLSYIAHVPAFYVKCYYNNSNCSYSSKVLETDTGNSSSWTWTASTNSIDNKSFEVVKGNRFYNCVITYTIDPGYRDEYYTRLVAYYNRGNGSDSLFYSGKASAYWEGSSTVDSFALPSYVSSDMSSDDGLNLLVRVTTGKVNPPRIDSCTDANDWKRRCTVYNPNPLEMDLYYTSNKNKSKNSINSSSDWSHAIKVSAFGSAWVIVSDQGGFSDEWITFGFRTTDNNYYCRTIDEDVTSGTPNVVWTGWLKH